MINTHKYISMLLALLLIAAAACRKDEGNYSYTDINELEVLNIPETVNVPYSAKLVVKPELKGSINSSADAYTYKYVLQDPNLVGEAKMVTIGTTKDIDVELKQTQGTYNAYFMATDKKTGVTWHKEFKITIQGALATRGWFFLSEVNGGASVQFFEEDMNNIGQFPVRYTDFLKLISDKTLSKPIELRGKPMYMHICNNLVFTAESTTKVWLNLGTEQDGQKINITNGYLWKAPSYPFVNETATMFPNVPEWLFFPTQGEGYAYYNGDLYTSYFGLSLLFGIPINRLTTGELLNLAPHVAYVLPGSITSVAFDRTSKSFVKHSSVTSRFMTKLPASSSPTGFDPNNMGMDLVWMGHTAAFAGQAVAVLKKTDGSHYLARMGYTISGTFDATSLEEITVPELKLAEKIAVDRTYGWLLYSVGGKLYKFDMDGKVNTLIKDYGNENSITLIKSGLNGYLPSWAIVERFPASYNAIQLAPPVKGVTVAYYDPANPNTSGKVDVWDLSSPTPTTYYSFDGFGKVKDVDYSRL